MSQHRIEGIDRFNQSRRRSAAACVLLLALLPAISIGQDFGKKLSELISRQPIPLFVVLQPSGIVEIAPDIRRIANEMPARLQQKNPDALWFEMTVLVAIPNAPTTATVLGEFKTRCAVLPASAYSGQDDQGPMRKAMAALVKVARSPQGIGDPKWASACTFGDDRLAAAYNGVMQFPQNGIQARLFGKLVYLTSTDASIMFVF